MDRSATRQVAVSRFSADVDGLLEIGAAAAATATSAAAAILYVQDRQLRMAALRDDQPERGELLRSLLTGADLNAAEGPFAVALGSGQNSLLDIPGIALLAASGAWAGTFDAAGVATLGLTPLRAGERSLGVLLTMRRVSDPAMSAADLAQQAQLADELAASLDVAATLRHLRNFGFLTDALPDAIIGFSREREVILWNSGAERMYGIAAEEALGLSLDDLVATDWGLPALGNSSLHGPGISLINQGSWTGRVRQRSSAGRALYADVSIVSVIEDGLLRGAVSINRDISDLVMAELQRAEQDRLLQAVLDASLAPQAVLDGAGVIVAVNSAWAADCASAQEDPALAELGVDYPAALLGAADISPAAARLGAEIAGVLAGQIGRCEQVLDVAPGGDTAVAHLVCARSLPGRQGGALITATDISTAPDESQPGLPSDMAGSLAVPPRRRLEAAVAAALATGTAVGAIMVKLPRLTDLGQALGPTRIDHLRRACAERLRSFPNASLVANTAADEFALVLPGVSDQTLPAVAAELAALASAPLRMPGGEISLAATLGLACSTDLPSSAGATDLLRAAEAALRRADQEGEAVVSYGEWLRGDLELRAELTSWQERLLATGQLRVAYVPQFRCDDGQLRGATALARWHHPAGVIPDERFARLASQSGTCVPIGSWLLAEACAHAGRVVAKSGRPFAVSVRTSAEQLVHAQFPEAVGVTLDATGLSAADLTLELPAAALARHPESTGPALLRARALGVGVCLTELGGGLPPPDLLSKFGVQELQLDLVLSPKLDHDERARAMVAGVLQAGHALGLRIVAMGVPSAGQLRMLREMGVVAYQGSLLPGGAGDELASWVSQLDPSEAPEVATRPAVLPSPRPRRAS